MNPTVGERSEVAAIRKTKRHASGFGREAVAPVERFGPRLVSPRKILEREDKVVSRQRREREPGGGLAELRSTEVPAALIGAATAFGGALALNAGRAAATGSKDAARAMDEVLASKLAALFSDRSDEDRPGESVDAPRPRNSPLAEAADLLRQTTLAPQLGDVSLVAGMLRRGARLEAERRPRNAALALAADDALLSTPEPFETNEKRRVLWLMAQAIVAQYIETSTEGDLLDKMQEAGLDRFLPFEQTALGEFLDEPSG